MALVLSKFSRRTGSYLDANERNKNTMKETLPNLMQELLKEAKFEEEKVVLRRLAEKGASTQFMADVIAWPLGDVQAFLQSE